MVQLWCYTFGGGTAAYRAAAQRLVRQVKAVQVFDHVLSFTEQDLRRQFPAFWKQHGAFLERFKKRGYGFWLWKVFLAHVMLTRRLNEGDVMLYMDAGCEFNKHGVSKLRSYVALAQQHGAVFFHNPDTHGTDRAYTKRDTLDYLGVTPDQSTLLDTPQLVGGVWFMQKNAQNEALVKRWLDTHCVAHHRYANDSRSKLPALRGFRAHRHDQSILSILVKQTKRYVSDDRLYWHPHWVKAKHMPILTMRTRSGQSRLPRALQ